MKAVLLAGGFGMRLRPLTLHTPKPIVPIFDRPFLYHQIDLLKRVPEVDEVILSLNYRPAQIEALVGKGEDAGLRVRYLVEPTPLGTGGAVKFAEPHLDGTTIVFNGDVLSEIDLAAVVRLHRERQARATIVLTPVDNPSAYGLVETDAAGHVQRFLEKPDPDQITCDTINAGIYVLEPDTFDRIPTDTRYSIERTYFPSLVERGETFVAYVDRGYWIDIGTPDKYLQAHRDIMDGRCRSALFADRPAAEPLIAADASVDPAAHIEGPCFVGPSATIHAGATIGAHAVIGRDTVVGADAVIRRTIVWPHSVIGEGATLEDAIIGRRCRVDDHAYLGAGVVLGDGSSVTSYTRSASRIDPP